MTRLRADAEQFVVAAVAPVVGFWRHPRATIRGWRMARRYPRPADFDRMSSQELDAYFRKAGLETRIQAALAENGPGGVSAESDAGLRVREKHA